MSEKPGHFLIDTSEPAWIRDASAAVVDIDSSQPEKIPQMIAEICAGEFSYCEHCGFSAPFWPTKQWADHILTEHAVNLTIQARTGTSQLCDEGINQSQQLFFSMMFGARVSMRRRAWKLGYTVIKSVPGWNPRSN